MATPIAMESRYLLDLLSDGQWHDAAEIIDKLALKIAPGKALRRYVEKEAQRVAKYGPRKHSELTEEQKIASGRRTLANVTLGSMKKNYVEVEGEGAARRVRRRPPSQWPRRLEDGLTDGEEEDESEEDEPVTTEDSNESIVAELATEVRRRDGELLDRLAQPGDNPFTCSRCGLWVVNAVQHETFHEEQDRAAPESELALLNEEQLRGLIREEIGAALARFQVRLVIDEEDEALIRGVVRGAVRTEVSAALDRFQDGMQGYLSDRLTELEAVVVSRPQRAGFFGGR